MKTLVLFSPSELSPCSYLPDRQSRSQYVDPRLWLVPEELNTLNRMGFRRSGRLVYRPQCPGCMECIPVRLYTKAFRPGRTTRRLLKRASSWQLSVTPADFSAEHYSLYERYISLRHSDGDMFPPTEKTFREFLTEDFGTTRFLNAHHQGRLIGTLVFDTFDDGLSSVYCFYDPDYEQYSVGTLLITHLTHLASALNLPFNYLGFWVKGCRKMEYKTRFSPLEWFRDGVWQPINPE
ncbi:arginyltransferase [uncultured Thalassolituus sp.]|uniref:arginyltransferase n=1 Tax=uncultured Thalassolituus sp. TaxID=285273 RepID=UPI0026334BEC|nr:arginyltransferase [uncultured Thalassolituus sp.]